MSDDTLKAINAKRAFVAALPAVAAMQDPTTVISIVTRPEGGRFIEATRTDSVVDALNIYFEHNIPVMEYLG